jgi:hypothetical protein
MPAFSFKKQFVEPIQAGTKHHTIRGERVDGRVPAKVGDQLSLFCGMRTKGCFRILPGTVPCTKVELITIEDAGRSSEDHFTKRVCIDGNPLDRSECQRLAQSDGFPDFGRMMMFWEGRLPFKGYIIHWR